MFTLPQIITSPLLANLGSGAATWPTVGALLAWAMIAALVGSALGILREYRRNAATPAASERVVSLQAIVHDPTHGHREAA